MPTSPGDGFRHAPLAPGYREEPLWRRDVTPPAPSPGPVPARADVVVVGGGYCGVAAGWDFARRDRTAVVLDARDLGYGASTRNGGMVIPELKPGPGTLARRYGSLGARLLDATDAAFDLVEKLTAELSPGCDYRRDGGLLLAHHRAGVAGLRRLERALVEERGEGARFVPGSELHAEIGSDAYHGGLLVERTGGLQPARFHAALAGAAAEAGALLHPHTRATRIEPAGSRFRVHTEQGVIDAGDVLVATNAYADGLLPELRRRVLPVGSFIIATEVLDPPVATDVSPRGRMFYDTKHFLSYWRLSPDRRLVFGGRTGLGRMTIGRARDQLYRQLVRVHPQVAGVVIEHAWGGDVAITSDRLPHCGRLEGVAFATGCNGTGVALAAWLGAGMAAWMCGDSEAPPFAALPFPAVPLHALRHAYLPVAGWGLRVLDRLGR